MAATYRRGLVTSINARFSTLIYQKNFAFASGKNASLVGFKLVQTGSFIPRRLRENLEVKLSLKRTARGTTSSSCHLS